MADKTQDHLHCPGPLPGPPYPPETGMTPVNRDRYGFISTLQYVDLWNEIEYIFDKTGLCTRAGCSCRNSIPVCYNRAPWEYDSRIALFYAPTCIKLCDCKQSDHTATNEALHIGNGTVNGSGSRVAYPGFALTIA